MCKEEERESTVYKDCEQEESKGGEVMETLNSMVAYDDGETPQHDFHISQSEVPVHTEESAPAKEDKLSLAKSMKLLLKKFKSHQEGEVVLGTYTTSLK